jgi:hypothetical protein
MPEIISFPRPAPSARDAAIERLATRLVAHLSASLYEKRVLGDVPVNDFVDRMRINMLGDGINYDPEILDMLGEDPKYLTRIEATMTRYLVAEGYLPAEFR